MFQSYLAPVTASDLLYFFKHHTITWLDKLGISLQQIVYATVSEKRCVSRQTIMCDDHTSVSPYLWLRVWQYTTKKTYGLLRTSALGR